jgi:hypothetical protein
VNWTAESLSQLLVDAGYASRLQERIWPLFDVAPPLPQTDRPGEPAHPLTNCLLWRGVHNGYYGQVWTGEKMEFIHVVTPRLIGSADTALDRAHQCERRLCSHPYHTREKSRQGNLREGRKRRYPDALLSLAPGRNCSCGTLMTPTIQAVAQGDRRYFQWHYSCSPCKRSYYRWRKSPGLPRVPTGSVYAPMDSSALLSLGYFLASENRPA